MAESVKGIAGYSYGAADVGVSPVSLEQLEALKVTVGFTSQDVDLLRRAGEVLRSQTTQIVQRWRSGIIAGIPNLARHSRSLTGDPLPKYLAASNLRFEQWILDTCLRPYDQDWLNYQQEIALRHTSLKKNQVDGAESTAFVPYRDIAAFVATLNDTIKPYMAAGGDSAEDVEAMHRAWCKSIQMQIALWSRTYLDLAGTKNEW
jgi:hypothetical protein